MFRSRDERVKEAQNSRLQIKNVICDFSCFYLNVFFFFEILIKNNDKKIHLAGKSFVLKVMMPKQLEEELKIVV